MALRIPRHSAVAVDPHWTGPIFDPEFTACPVCGGFGSIEYEWFAEDGVSIYSEECSECEGEGEICA